MLFRPFCCPSHHLLAPAAAALMKRFVYLRSYIQTCAYKQTRTGQNARCEPRTSAAYYTCDRLGTCDTRASSPTCIVPSGPTRIFLDPTYELRSYCILHITHTMLSQATRIRLISAAIIAAARWRLLVADSRCPKIPLDARLHRYLSLICSVLHLRSVR